MFSFSSPIQTRTYQLLFSSAPQTPTPLRTSYNANRMEQQPQQPTIKSSPLTSHTSFTWPASEDTENIFSPQRPSAEPDTANETPKTCFTSATTPSTTASNASAISSSSKISMFENRARSSSPAAQLNARVAKDREDRKTTFLNRIRNRRGDARDDRMGDQIMRLDYVRSQKEWEARKQHEFEAPGDTNADEEEDDTPMVDDELSPTEEKEIEELASMYRPDEQMMSDPLDDEEYDQLFMELSTSQAGNQMDMT